MRHAPETLFTQVAGRSLAFQVCGHGELDLLFTPGSFNHVDVWWEHPVTNEFLSTLASFSRLILFDRRGTGASDPLPTDELPNWRDWLDDMRAVLDAAGSKRAAIFASLDGGPTALALAAAEPERVSRLVLYNCTARFRAAEDYACGVDDERAESIVTTLREHWGTEAFSAMNYPERAQDSDFLRWYAKYQRASINKGRVEAVARAWFDIDVRALLAQVQVPVLVMQREQYNIVPEVQGRYLADHLTHATYHKLAGGSALFAPDADDVLNAAKRFLTGRGLSPGEAHPRSLPSEVPGYRLIRIIGHGGMGEVWEALNDAGGPPVAIKLVRGAGSETLQRRLLREGKALISLQHPGIVSVREVTRATDGSPAIVMELLIGQSLRERLANGSRPTLAEGVRLLTEIAAAVSASHACDIVHRDLKPANIFLSGDAGQAQTVKLLDFGLAKTFTEDADASHLTTTGALLGTPAYMAPEQLFGEPLDHRADIWALGLIAFEMLTGKLPTMASHIGQVVKAIVGGCRWRMDSFAAGLPPPLVELVAQMLAREPAQRPASVEEVLARLSSLGLGDR